MKKKLYIYWISARAYYPVCDAGAVVIAENPKQALELAGDLNKPEKPLMIGVAAKRYKKAELIVTNNGDY